MVEFYCKIIAREREKRWKNCRIKGGNTILHPFSLYAVSVTAIKIHPLPRVGKGGGYGVGESVLADDHFLGFARAVGVGTYADKSAAGTTLNTHTLQVVILNSNNLCSLNISDAGNIAGALKAKVVIIGYVVLVIGCEFEA